VLELLWAGARKTTALKRLSAFTNELSGQWAFAQQAKREVTQAQPEALARCDGGSGLLSGMSWTAPVASVDEPLLVRCLLKIPGGGRLVQKRAA